MKVLRISAVVQKTGMSRSWLYREIEAGRFVPQVELGSRARGYLESDVDAWLEARKQQKAA
jgi:prophage regulatory protein